MNCKLIEWKCSEEKEEPMYLITNDEMNKEGAAARKAHSRDLIMTF